MLWIYGHVTCFLKKTYIFLVKLSDLAATYFSSAYSVCLACRSPEVFTEQSLYGNVAFHSLPAHSENCILVEFTVGKFLSWIYHLHERIIMIPYFKKRGKTHKGYLSALYCFCIWNLWLRKKPFRLYRNPVMCTLKFNSSQAVLLVLLNCHWCFLIYISPNHPRSQMLLFLHFPLILHQEKWANSSCSLFICPDKCSLWEIA